MTIPRPVRIALLALGFAASLLIAASADQDLNSDPCRGATYLTAEPTQIAACRQAP